MSKYKFPCGCEFDILEGDVKDCDGLPPLFIDYYNLPDNCPATWELIQSGHTKGIFQLETNLGRKWSKELLPRDINEMAALISLIRPGVLRAIVDGKSMSQHYCDRKNKGAEIKYFHQALEPILKETYGTSLFQEQSLKIAQIIAGFTLEEADTLRRAIGHKEADVMAKVKKKFIDGCQRVGTVTLEEAEQIFGWIQESQRYSFNACLSPTTVVETKDGWSTLEAILIGDMVKAPSDDLSNGKDEFVEVVNKFDNGPRMLYEIRTESGFFIQCTLNHKFLCEDGKIRPLNEITLRRHRICTFEKFDYIGTTKALGVSNTVDIEVKNTHHLFYGNGIITSNSHGVAYGTIGYWTAYVKAHFPLHFVTAWLYYAHEKMDAQEEVQQLVSDGKYFGIPVLPPSLTRLFNGDPGHFSMFKDSVYFGIGDIKKIGESHVKKVLTSVSELELSLGKAIGEWNWCDFLIHFSDTVSQTVVNGLVQAGATDYMGGSRSEKIHEFNEWRKLTQKERDWIKSDIPKTKLIDSISSLLANIKRLSAPRRLKIEDIVKSLNSPSFSLEDDAYYIADHEKELLGIPLTCTKLDTCHNEIEPNTTCKEFLQGKSGNISIRVEIIGVSEYIIKNGKSKGQKMLFLQVEDDTGSLESVVVFPNVLHENQSILIDGGTVVLEGKRDAKQTNSFIVENVIPI